ncbi:flavodoxin family protein [bacterium]|nr:flavodoxin family protein [bacterium]
MKIVGLCASPRAQGNTLRLLNHFLDQCEALGATTVVYSVRDFKVDFCRGCEQCMRLGTCPVADDYSPLLPEIVDADALVLATPNYAFDMSAQLKAVLDRSHAFLYYSQALRGKYGIGICVGGHRAMTRKIAAWCAQAVWLCGGNAVGVLWGVSKCRDKKGLIKEKKVFMQANRLAQKLVKQIQQKKQYPFRAWVRETFLVSKLRRGFLRRREEYPWIAAQFEAPKHSPQVDIRCVDSQSEEDGK